MNGVVAIILLVVTSGVITDVSRAATPAKDPDVSMLLTATGTASVAGNESGSSAEGLGAAQPPPTTTTETDPNLKVAFIGDQGSNANSVAVLQLIAAEGADMVLHQGDFDYGDDPTTWEAQINSVLGSDFPYFATVGNHDVAAWSGVGGYQEKLAARVDRIVGATCTGELGVNAACHYRGLFFILSGVGTLGSGHDTFIRDELAADDALWSVCAWHKNQSAMQVGGKGDEVGWAAYEECRVGGAIVATAHEHSYSRTKTLSSFESQTVDPAYPDSDDLAVTAGSSFAFVSGLGGQSVRDQERCLPATYPYGCNGEWASIYSTTQGGTYGVLFCTFHVDGLPEKATCYFKDINGIVVDDFTVTSGLASAPPPPPPPPRGTFSDDDTSIFEADIEWLVDQGITLGCNPEGTLYCPLASATRAQMASFLVWALGIPPAASNRFSDVGGTHLANINALAEAGITVGCNAAGNDYCPDDPVTRAQMASFLARALPLDPIEGDVFEDVAGTHEPNINAIAAAGITVGCDADGTLYCPNDPVTRGQMAAFLHRALG